MTKSGTIAVVAAAISGAALLVCGARGAAAATTPPAPAETAHTAACDREMRKTFEAIQAYRRQHGGQYPGHLFHLMAAGLLPDGSGICPNNRHEEAGASAVHGQASSRGLGKDPAGMYEYELSAGPEKFDFDRHHVPAGTPRYTRGDVKSRLLLRPFFEQVPVLRCSSHRLEAPTNFPAGTEVRRNLTTTGGVYWSGTYWESMWVEDVPYCARDANVLFGLEGPPFHSGKQPAIDGAIDLRAWSNSFGDTTWWWTYPLFGEGANRQWTAHLGPFFRARHGVARRLGNEEWWIDALTQLQGRITSDYSRQYDEPGLLAFPWRRVGAPVGRRITGARWLQGTVWRVATGETAGWLVWHYADGRETKVPLVYGKSIARFWGDTQQVATEQGFPEPVWREHQSKADVGRERWLRLYRQSWANPFPDIEVTSVDFVSNPDSPAAPFLVSLSVTPAGGPRIE